MTATNDRPALTTPSGFSVAALTDTGGRASNEDLCAFIETREAVLLVLADGAGGHARGEVASRFVVQGVLRYFDELGEFTPGAEALAGALRAAQDGLIAEIETNPLHFDLRSTGVLVLATPTRCWVGHVGDSRAYLVRDGAVRALTRDDTLVQTLVDLGQITPQAARTHSKASVLLQALGEPREDMEFHVTEAVEVRPGDAIVACSDGLSDVVSDDEIARLAGDGAAGVIAARLLRRALAAPPRDNVTVGVIAWR